MAGKKKKKDLVVEDGINIDIQEELKGGLDPAPNRIKSISDKGGIVAHLQTINYDLQSVSNTITENLLELMKSNEELTRETYLAQVEIKRAEELEGGLTGNLAKFKAELSGLKKTTEKLDGDVTDLSADLKLLNVSSNKLEKSKAKLAEEVSGLSSDCDSLKTDNGKLKGKKDKLAGEVASLKKIREEYLAQISKFKDMKDDLLT